MRISSKVIGAPNVMMKGNLSRETERLRGNRQFHESVFATSRTVLIEPDSGTCH